MSITTERPIGNTTADTGSRRAVRPAPLRVGSTRRRASVGTRRYVRPGTPQGWSGAHFADAGSNSCVHDDTSRRTMSWTTMVLGVAATAVVLLALVFVANLRAGSLDAEAQSDVATVQTGETIGDVAARVAPDAPVQQAVDRLLAINGLTSATLSEGQQLLVPAVAE